MASGEKRATLTIKALFYGKQNNILQNKGKVAKSFETEFSYLSKMRDVFSCTVKYLDKGFTAVIPTRLFCEADSAAIRSRYDRGNPSPVRVLPWT